MSIIGSLILSLIVFLLVVLILDLIFKLGLRKTCGNALDRRFNCHPFFTNLLENLPWYVLGMVAIARSIYSHFRS